MKYGITLIVSLFFHLSLFGQAPANDECINAIDLGMAPSCDEAVYTNVDATTSDVGMFNLPECWQSGNTDRDVWFAFTPSDTIEDYRISIIGEAANGDPAIVNPQVAVFRGTCGIDMIFPDAACAVADPGTGEVTADFFGPDLGITYYIRVNDNGAAGSFRVCVEERPEIYTIDEGGAEACSGFLFDTGGPDGNYGDNENHTFVICPNVPNNCINMSFEYFNFETADESLTIYDGPDASGTQLAVLNSFNSDYANAGGVCFETRASSGCMTLVFQSDAQVNFEGFSAFWECSPTACETPAQLSVNDDVTAEELALAIAGAETQLEVTNINCPEGYYGTFNAEGTDLGLGNGIILGSGNISNAIGPNTSPSQATIGGNPGDADLDSLSLLQNGVLIASMDACVVELEVQAATDELVFEYVFGSEEYPEFVNLPGSPTGFNDVFAFFISGPDIDGIPALDDQINIATLPDGTPVEINSVNEGLNWQYYRNNTFGQSIQYDGLTSDSLGIKKSLTARATVTPCKTYRLKLAVADRGDSNYDSGVFISDIRSGAPQAAVDFTSGVDYLVEDCLADIPDTLVVTLQNNGEDSIRYGINIGGTATQGLDYLFPNLPDSITFGPGFNEFKFPIIVLSDLLEEGTETITIAFTIDFGCGVVSASSIEIELRDDLNIEINIGSDTVIYCADNSIELTATGAADFVWLPDGIFVDNTGATVIANPMGEVLVTAVGTLGNCVDSAQVLLIPVDPMIDILAADTIFACSGDTITLFQENNIENSNLMWTDAFNLVSDPTDDSLVIAPTFDQEIQVTVSLAGCTATDSVYFDFGFVSIPTVIQDTTICQGFPITLIETPFFNFSTDYAWSPEEDFDDPTDPASVAFPENGVQTYTLISSSQFGMCADTQMVTVTTIPSDIEILNGDLVEVCVGYDSVVLNAQVTPPGSEIIWSPSSAGVLTNFGDSLSVRPGISVQYTATYTVNGCTQSDTVLVKVDSLPVNTDIMLDPFKDPYCQGDTFFLVSPIYDVGDFSSITHMWIDAPGLQTGDSLYNGFVLAQDTSLFQRITMNGACSRTDSVQVNVVQPPAFTLTPMDTTICPGGSVQFVFELLDGAMGEVTWEPDDGSLSCTDCFTPIATPTSSTEYTVTLTSEGSDCDFPIMATVGIFGPTELDVIDNNQICPGETIVPFVGAPQLGVTYQVTGPGVDSQDPLVEITPMENGTYEYTAFGPCDTVTAFADVTIIQPVTLTADGPTQACAGDEITFTASTDAPSGQEGFFTWSINGTVDPDGGLSSFTTTLPIGNSTIEVTYTNECEVVTTDAIIVTVSPAPSLELTNITSICSGESVTLNLDPNVNTTTYVWTGSDGFSSTDAAPTVSPTMTTTYTVTATSAGCDPITDDVTIQVIEPYTLLGLEGLLVCSGDEVSVTAATDPNDVAGSYEWIGPAGNTVATEANLAITPDTSGTYSVTFTDAAGCFPAQTQSFFVEVIPELVPPSIVITDEDNFVIISGDTVFNGETVILNAENGSLFDYTYSWDGNGDPTTGTGPSLSVITPVPDGDEGTLSYTLTYTTELGGCSGTTQISLPISRARFKIPDLITPNNDGTNDIFRVFYNGVITDYQLLVFNRWGQVVFETTDPDQGWDGSTDGKVQAMDVYLYRAKFNQNGQDFERDGQFSLVR